MEFKRQKRRHSHINVTPLVDVVFNLVLFFVITYNVTADPGIRIQLPQSSTAQIQQEEVITIHVSRDGQIFIEDMSVSLSEISSVLQARAGSGGGAMVKIRADQESSVGLLVQIVDAVRIGGFSSFSILTEKK